MEVHDPHMVGQVGYDLNLMKVIQRHNISYILKATNANSITMVFWEKDLSEPLLTELKGLYFKVTVKEAALVCAMGTNITYPGSLAKASYCAIPGRSECGGGIPVTYAGEYAVCDWQEGLPHGYQGTEPGTLPGGMRAGVTLNHLF